MMEIVKVEMDVVLIVRKREDSFVLVLGFLVLLFVEMD